ncbi:beta-1,6-N-acetylglucosaminyltransferase [Limimaricola pyoseonensis]|uniref:Peptide O-xylosyltransferase n=1 Tax=Limimaricola pyoseonensis TaxID=521013 RepID=A0A1G7ETL9_9RHOB|nr:beta-1,6-N-acetylglucosaminyltransferase [Limimaricola pyoseonensis]SDE66927.1 Core-2/I-Branching enzyme [Limimaricola pyoseonensis]
MSLGIVLLAHDNLGRAAQAARIWAEAGCPVVVHLDRRVPTSGMLRLQADLSDLSDRVLFCRRHRCDWGGWGIVAATLEAAATLLLRWPAIGHAYLVSGACLPLRPVAELQAFLAARPGLDFIESAAVADVPWAQDGLSEERFTLRFPFSWKRQRRLFDAHVALQRRLGLRRSLPEGLEPHLGAQWWCLSGRTLRAILADPRRPEFDRYFRRVWIPDESYFQTLARRHSVTLESRSLTLARFDAQGKPHILYDDHAPALAASGCFVARKIWPGAERLYAAARAGQRLAPGPEPIEPAFAAARLRRTRGRPGLAMQGRLPRPGWEYGASPGPWTVLQGFDELWEGWEAWFTRATGAELHGRLFAPGRVEFAGGAALWRGALPASPAWRDHDPERFQGNLLWNGRGRVQAFCAAPGDLAPVMQRLAADPEARVGVISGAWALRLARSGRPAVALRAEAARLQRAEAELLAALRAPQARARARIWTLSEALAAPMAPLFAMAAETAPGARPGLAAAPRLARPEGLGRLLAALRDLGTPPYLAGDLDALCAPRDEARA